MNPLAPTLKAVTLVLHVLLSVQKCVYLSAFTLCFEAMRSSNKILSSSISNQLFSTSRTVISGFCTGTVRAACTVQPFWVVWPSTSECTVYFWSIIFTMNLTIISWRQTYQPWFRATWYNLSVCSVVSLLPHKWHLSAKALFQSLKLFLVGSLWFVELIINLQCQTWGFTWTTTI